MDILPPAGKIITFYSYKGGTGRSMALANVAWILAANRKKVFVIDWDLEAPGLHRYFRPFLIDKELSSSNGLIDVVHSYVEDTIEELAENSAAFADAEAVRQWVDSFADIAKHAISLDFKFAGEGYIDFLPAGRQIAAYPERVNTFNWHEFYKRFGGGEFLEAVKRRLRAQYDYILIDSRTGVSDTSGISTVQMPDILAVCFTYNNQSIAGSAAIAESVREARAEDGQEPLVIFPIPTRVEQSERAKLLVRQGYARHRFAALIGHVPEHLRMRYWTEVEIPYIPFHAYEETLAALTDNPNDEKLILKAMRRITSQLTGGAIANYQAGVTGDALKAILKEFADTHPSYALAQPEASADEVARTSSASSHDIVTEADLQMAMLNANDAASARKLWQRLVSVRESSAGPVLSSWPMELRALSEDEVRIAVAFQQAGLMRRYDAGGAEFVEIANDALLRRWEPLQAWVTEDRAFLEWRAQLTEARQRWENNGRQARFLLAGPVLDNASPWIKSRRADLTDEDLAFLQKSKLYVSRKSRVLLTSLAMLGFAFSVTLGTYAYYQKESALAAEAREQVILAELQKSKELIDRVNMVALDPVAHTDALPTGPALLPTPRAASQGAPSPGRTSQGMPAAADSKPRLPPSYHKAPKPDEADDGPGLPTQRVPSADSELPIRTRSIGAALKAESARRGAIELTYFAKAGDPPNTAPELSKLGYKITLGASPVFLPTNTIWFGCGEPLTSDDARELATLLIREGVALRKLDTFTGPRGAAPIVHIGAAKAHLRLRPLTDAEVNAFDLEAACHKDPIAAGT